MRNYTLCQSTLLTTTTTASTIPLTALFSSSVAISIIFVLQAVSQIRALQAVSQICALQAGCQICALQAVSQICALQAGWRIPVSTDVLGVSFCRWWPAFL